MGYWSSHVCGNDYADEVLYSVYTAIENGETNGNNLMRIAFEHDWANYMDEIGSIAAPLGVYWCLTQDHKYSSKLSHLVDDGEVLNTPRNRQQRTIALCEETAEELRNDIRDYEQREPHDACGDDDYEGWKQKLTFCEEFIGNVQSINIL